MIKLYDLKTGARRNYRPQMAFYALGLMQKHDETACEVHLLYSRYAEAAVYIITREEAEKVVYEVEARRNNPDRQETPCDYCSWCRRRGKCKALAQVVRDNVEDFDSEDTGQKMDVSRQCLVWAAEVKAEALAEAQGGKVPAGYRLVSRTSGNKKIEYLKKENK